MEMIFEQMGLEATISNCLSFVFDSNLFQAFLVRQESIDWQNPLCWDIRRQLLLLRIGFLISNLLSECQNCKFHLRT